MLIKSTTRHIHIFTAEIQAEELVENDQKLTLDIDPDNEFIWTSEALQQVYRKFDQLVDSNQGEDLTEYNLRRIGSDLEHFIRSMLQEGTISYNLNTRAVNYSLGLPRIEANESSN
ncbi:MAG: NAD(P)H-quinone oxidoreductase subunit M [Microcoleaceae cyanobacterium]